MAIVKPFRFIPTIARKELNYDFADFTSFPQLFSTQEVENIKNLWSQEFVKSAEVNLAGNAISRNDLRKSQIMFIKTGANDWIYDKLGQACIQANSNRYKFDVKGFQTELQLANYGIQDFFEWHMDFGAGDISDRKLSITVQLSDPTEYEGGDLQFMINHEVFTAPKEKGTAIIFPSFAQHRVTRVTQGNRKSIVGWIAGPPYR